MQLVLYIALYGLAVLLCGLVFGLSIRPAVRKYEAARKFNPNFRKQIVLGDLFSLAVLASIAALALTKSWSPETQLSILVFFAIWASIIAFISWLYAIEICNGLRLRTGLRRMWLTTIGFPLPMVITFTGIPAGMVLLLDYLPRAGELPLPIWGCVGLLVVTFIIGTIFWILNRFVLIGISGLDNASKSNERPNDFRRSNVEVSQDMRTL